MITFENVTKQYPDKTKAVDNLSFIAPARKLTILVGPSGCGKTTTLRMVNRLIRPSSGVIRLGGVATGSMDEAVLRRKIGYVIQHAGLFPHRTVLDNIATTARLNGKSRREARAIAYELLERVGLQGAFALRYPWQLSGGQQQRVGVARALAADPEYMLMDEPFSAVDPVVRTQLQDEFLRLQSEIGKTIIMVTHDIDEALKLGDQVAVLRTGGRLAQLASPKDLLERPADAFVADFIGRDRGYRSLAFRKAGCNLVVDHEPTVKLGDSQETARLLANDKWLLVVDDLDRPLGWVEPARLNGSVREEDINRSGTIASVQESMRQLLDSVLSSPCGRGVVVGDDNALIGSLRGEQIIGLIDGCASESMRRAV
ncbi:ABC transporter ATP-binding protein [Burkholderia diffusa]|uniref:ABC transporter ATP-binding protein n=1 Tax=Burkholderia diffusa TaxID=488732 RepID=UPI00157B931B|nr:ATP-binding cassette domain-containing protein [Burkholderia diffusa]NTY41599.1 ATP-binding cassette domain-containing protein [Burkholderia diffusa]